MEKERKISMNIDNDLYKEFKIYAIKHNSSMTQLITDMIKNYLKYDNFNESSDDHDDDEKDFIMFQSVADYNNFMKQKNKEE